MGGSANMRFPDNGLVMITWGSLSGTENGEGAITAKYPDKTVTAAGTFTGITMQGSNDGVNWMTLHDPQGSAITFAAPGIAVIAENPLYIRPSATGAGAGCMVIVVGRTET